MYVDDILLAGQTDDRIAEVKKNLVSRFGVKMIQDIKQGTVWIGQPSYAENILHHFKMYKAKATKSPVNPSLKLRKATDDSECVNLKMYQSAVGNHLYLSTRTCPDITFACVMLLNTLPNKLNYTGKP